MDKETKVENLMGVSIDKIKQMVDVSTVVGDPIPLSGGTTLIPVSKVSYGFASGGSDLPTKGEKDLFGGGGGAGINITPIAFIAVSITSSTPSPRTTSGCCRWSPAQIPTARSSI